jgi:hypothetical protein
MKDKIKNTLPKTNLTHGNINLGNHSINGLQIFEDTVVIPFYFNGSNKARSTTTLENILKLCDGFANQCDWNIPYSYVRMEIDPVETTIQSNTNILIHSLGLEEEGMGEYFASNINCNLDGIADFLYLDRGMDSKPIDKIKQKRDKYMTMFLNGNVTNATVYLEITLFYFYIPSIHSQRINNAKIKGEGRSKQFYAIDFIKNNNYFKKTRNDETIEENEHTLNRQENPFRINDRVQFVYYDEYSIKRYLNLRIVGFSTNVFTDDIIELNENMPNVEGYIFGVQNPCLEENCKWHNGSVNPMKHKYDEQCNDCRNTNGCCNSRANYPYFNNNGRYRNWRF